MVSLRTQLDRCREQRKRDLRRLQRKEKTNLPYMRIGDRGCPYHGKDTFSGQNRKFADRVYPTGGGYFRLIHI